MPRLLAGQRLLLTRFWIPFTGAEENDETPTLRLHDGILPDPEDNYGKLCNPTLQTISEIQRKRCFALLGQPGLGKSIAVDQWVDELRLQARPEDEVVHLTGRGLATPEEIRYDTVLSSSWQRARAAGGDIALILDGLDEALQRLPVLLSSLRKCLKDEPMARTRLALISRVADWRDSRAEQVFALWPTNERGGAFELCPLRWRDIHEATEKSKVSAAKFQRAVLERRVGWMAGRPKLLLMLLEEFQRHRRLPDSRRELFVRAAMRMCQEHDPERHEVLERSQRPVVPAEHLFPLVERVSAVLLITGKTHILCDPEANRKPSDLLMADLLGGAEPLNHGMIEADVTRIAAALDTAHFVASGPSRLCFDHQQMGEFMAARYLSRCTARQLRNLLTQRVDGNGYLSPQFRELSAWIATQHLEFRDFVVEHEPRLLIDSDSVDLDNATRGATVSAMLTQLAHGDTTDAYLSEHSLRSFRHPGLTRQLRPYVDGLDCNIVVRRTAMRIAGAARCTNLKPALWRVVAEPSQVHLQHSAMSALAEMGSAEDKKRFIGALRNNLGPDGNEEIKGEALLFLVPKYLPVAAVLKYLSPRDENRVGAYYNALHHHLPGAVRTSDIGPIFRAYASREKQRARTGPIRFVVVAAVGLALRRFDDVPVRTACLKFLGSELQKHSWEGTWEALKPPGCSKTVERNWRRALLESFVAHASGRYISFHRFGLWPQREDFRWLLQKVRTTKGMQLTVWANLAARLTFEGVPRPLFQEFQHTYDVSTTFRKQLPTPRKFGLHETLRRRARAVELWRELWRRRAERREAEEAKGKLTVDEAVRRLRSGDVKQWVTFTRVLDRHEREAKRPRQRSYDITAWEVWSKLSSSDQKVAADTAARFLSEGKMPIRKAGFVYTWDKAAVPAMVLVLSRIARSSVLRAAIKREWVPAILRELYNGEPELKALACLAYQLDAAQCIDWCKHEIKRVKKQNSSFYSLRGFKHCWDTRLTGLIRELALDPRQKPRTVLYAFSLLREMSPIGARQLWTTVSARTARRGFTKRGRLIAFLGLIAFPKVGWDDALSRVLRQSRRKQIRMFAEYVRFLSYDFRDSVERMTDHQLGRLYELLADLFPPTKIRDYARGGSVRARDHLADLQRACLNLLVQRGTHPARSELRRLLVTVAPENRLWMKWRLREAIDQSLRTQWVDDPPSASAIMKMVRVSGALRVRDSEELQEAIISSLTRLQSAMHAGEFPKLPEFWRVPRTTPKPEREVARGIAAWLQQDLRGDYGLVVDREPQVGFTGHVDIKVECPAHQAARRPRLRVVIEVKNCTHQHVQTASESQLAEGYLRRKGITNGIYLVAWFDVPTSRVRWGSAEIATSEVDQWATRASSSAAAVTGFALDCRWRDMESPSSLASTTKYGRS